MGDHVTQMLCNRFLPLSIEDHFTAQRAPDMWFGDELPPTLQDYLNRPEVKQAKAIATLKALQEIETDLRQRVEYQTAYKKRVRRRTNRAKRG